MMRKCGQMIVVRGRCNAQSEICSLRSPHAPFQMFARLVFAASFLLVLSASSGCTQFAAAWANMSGGDWIEPEFELTRAPLLVLVDDRKGYITEPRAMREVHQTISENFVEFDVNKQIVPFQDWQRLQSDPDYAGLTIREIGERLGADQVLYLDVERFTLHAEVGAPVFKGDFAVRVKVLSTDRKSDVRLWPDGEAGRLIEVSTHPKPVDEDTSPVDVAGELGIKMGQEVSKLFYGRREFKR